MGSHLAQSWSAPGKRSVAHWQTACLDRKVCKVLLELLLSAIREFIDFQNGVAKFGTVTWKFLYVLTLNWACWKNPIKAINKQTPIPGPTVPIELLQHYWNCLLEGRGSSTPTWPVSRQYQAGFFQGKFLHLQCSSIAFCGRFTQRDQNGELSDHEKWMCILSRFWTLNDRALYWNVISFYNHVTA